MLCLDAKRATVMVFSLCLLPVSTARKKKTMGDKSPKSKSKNQAQKDAAKTQQQNKKDKRQAGFNSSQDTPTKKSK